MFRFRSAGSLSDVTVTSSVKVTELCEPSGDVMYKYKYIILML